MRRTLPETSVSEGIPMPIYGCCFLDKDGQTLRTEAFRACDDLDARREAMTRMTRVGRFSGYELWVEGRKVVAHGPVKNTPPVTQRK
jgi:hypothetical protein